ncbi:MAG: flippase [Pseudomonadota bacterium]|nr:hypothetical protein [Rhodospirillaceae bacterium]MEE2722754.1 flippase [Pseudomonadota bacterium]
MPAPTPETNKGLQRLSGQRILRNAMMLGSAQVLSMLAGLVSTAWVARALGPEVYGILGFGAAFVSYFAYVVVFGTDFFGNREVASAPDRAGYVVSSILSVRIVLLGLVSILYLLAVAASGQPEPVAIVMVIQILGLFSAGFAIDFLFQGLQRLGPVALRQSGAALLSLLMILLLVDAPEDIYAAAAIPFSAMLISALALAWFARRTVPDIGVSLDSAAVANVLRSSGPIAIAGFLGLIYMSADIVILGFLRPTEEVGIYAAVSRLFILSLFAGEIVTAVFSPALSAAWPEPADMKSVYDKHLRVGNFLGVPVCASIAAFPETLILIVFGDAFLAGAPLLRILALAAVFSYLGMAGLAALIAWRDQKMQVAVYATAAGLNVLLNIWLIPRHGALGAAYATLLAQLAMTLFVWMRIRCRFRVLEIRAPGLILVIGTASFFAAWLIFGALPNDRLSGAFWLWPTVLSGIAVALYFTVLLALKVIDRTELMALLPGKNHSDRGTAE